MIYGIGASIDISVRSVLRESRPGFPARGHDSESKRWLSSLEMPFPWVAAPACGENFPAGAGDHLRPKTKEGTFFLQKEGGFGAFSVS